MLPRDIGEQNADMEKAMDICIAKAMSMINCCIPGSVLSFDPETQTAVIRPLVKKRIRKNGGVEEMQIPDLMDVPVLMLGGGNHYLSFPVQAGDECLVLFSDLCIDAWFQSGGVQGQILPRQHDLSDGFAIVGFRSKPNALENFNEEAPYVTDLNIGGENVFDAAHPIGSFYFCESSESPKDQGISNGEWELVSSGNGYCWKRVDP